MTTGRCTCRYCRPSTEEPAAPVAHQPVQLPSGPRTFRVHHDGRTQDCTLHPDGRLSTHMAGQNWVSALSFDEMRERNWATAHIEWDPAPLPEQPEPEQQFATQDALNAA